MTTNIQQIRVSARPVTRSLPYPVANAIALLVSAGSMTLVAWLIARIGG